MERTISLGRNPLNPILGRQRPWRRRRLLGGRRLDDGILNLIPTVPLSQSPANEIARLLETRVRPEDSARSAASLALRESGAILPRLAVSARIARSNSSTPPGAAEMAARSLLS